MLKFHFHRASSQGREVSAIIILFRRVETCLKLFQNYFTGLGIFSNMFVVAEIILK